MTAARHRNGHDPIDRGEQIYRRLLVAYPRDFRDEYGEDLVQSFRDLMVFTTDGRGVWWRTVRDLVSSATRERASMFSGGRGPRLGVVFVLAAIVVATLTGGVAAGGTGIGVPVILLPTIVLIGLPVYGITRFHRAWLIRRTTGGAIAGQVAAGVASFLPAAVSLVLLREDAGYFVFVAVGLALIVGGALGVIWAVVALATSRSRSTERSWRRPVLVLIPSVAVLGIIIGASYNSYRQSLGPPGDHSADNASVDSKSLWNAAGTGDVAEVVRITTDTCADPWVKFPVDDGRHNAKGWAETRELDLPDAQEPPYRQISDILGDYMDEWYDRCGRSD